MQKKAQLFKSLADVTRLKTLLLLMGGEELCVCDFMEVLGISQSKASRHLRYLYNAGLVLDRREGPWMYYRIAVAPESPEEKQLKLLAEMLDSHHEAQALRERLVQWKSKDKKVCNGKLVTESPKGVSDEEQRLGTI
jgi:ArsR family transcriptional regulator